MTIFTLFLSGRLKSTNLLWKTSGAFLVVLLIGFLMTPGYMTAQNPLIGIAKRTVDIDNLGDGNYKITLELNIQNYGDVALDSLQVIDPLDTVFHAPCAIKEITLTSDAFKVNPNYDGVTDTTLLIGNDTLQVGVKGAILMMVTVDSCVTPTDTLFSNKAVAFNIVSGMIEAQDTSVNGSDPDPDGDGDPTNNTSNTPILLTEGPVIGVAKNMSYGPVNNGDGTYDLTFEIRVENFGDIDIDSLQVIDDLALVFGDSCGTWEVLGLESEEFSVNWPSGYDGEADSALLIGDDMLHPGDEGAIYLHLRVGPCDTLGLFENSAIAMGTSPGGAMLNDTSQVGTDPDPDGDGDPTNNNDPTPFQLEENAVFGVAKRVTKITNNEDGTYDVTFEMNVKNYGDVLIDSVQVADTLSTTFMDACNWEVIEITSDEFTVNTSYDGDTDVGLLTGADILPVNGKGAILLTVRVEPCNNIFDYENFAVATGVSPSGMMVQDSSANGSDPDPDGNGDPTDDFSVTPVNLDENPLIGGAKRTVGVINRGDGTYDVIYEINIENYGDVGLDSIQVVDSLINTFPDPCMILDVVLTSDDFKVDTAYDGVTNTTLLLGIDDLPVGDKGAVLMTVTVDDCTSEGTTVFLNFATVEGVSPAGEEVMDSTANGSDPDPGGVEGDPTDDQSGTPVRLDEEPSIGTAKNVSYGPVNNGDGTHDMTIEIRVENRGNVDIDSLQVIDDLEDVFGTNCDWEVLGLESEEFSVNWPAGYDGGADSSLLRGDDMLKAWNEGAIYIHLRVGPCNMLGTFENSAVAGGISPGGVMLSDSSQSGTEPDFDGDGETMDDNDPTPFELEENALFGVAKRVTKVMSNQDGTYDVTFELNIKNYGDVLVDSVQVADTLSTTFMDACDWEVIEITSDDFSVNVSFDGSTDVDLLLGTDVMSVGDKGAILMTVRVEPCNDIFVYDNFAVATGVSPSGMMLRDSSVNGSDPDPNGNEDPTDDFSVTPVNLDENPLIGGAKRTVAVINRGDGSYDVLYEINIENYGDVGLDSIQVVDSLINTFPDPCMILEVVLTSDDFKVDTAYDGVTNTTLLLGIDDLPVGDKGAILMTVTVDECTSEGTPVFLNFATVEGVSPAGEEVMDSTVNGSDPDPGGVEGDPTDDQSGTPARLDEEPVLGVAKNVSYGPVNNGDGTYEMTIEIRVENQGNVDIDSLQVIDDLEDVFGTNCDWEVLGLESEEFSVNWPAGYDGGADSSLLRGDDMLKAWNEGAIYLHLRVGPCDMLGMFENSALATGISPGGVMLSDSSQTGTEPDIDGNGDPTDNNDPTPFELEENPSIGVAKRLVMIPQLNENGSYTMMFEINVENFGDVNLDSVQVKDTLNDFDCIIKKISLTSDDFIINPNYDGITDVNLLNGWEKLLVGDKGAILLEVTIDSCNGFGPFLNSAYAMAVSPSGEMVSDTSVDGSDPDPNGDGNPDEESPTQVGLPGIAVVKTFNTTTSPPTLLNNGFYKVTFDYTISNVGVDTLTEIHLYDDFQNQFGCVFKNMIMGLTVTDVSVIANGGVLPDTNAVFTGTIPADDMLDGTGVFPPGSSFLVSVMLQIDPDCSGAPDTLLNQARVQAMDPQGNIVRDLSDDNLTTENDPTGVPLAAIGVSKAVFSVTPAVQDGNFNVIYLIKAQNTGNVQLTGVQLTDPVSVQLAPAVVDDSTMVVQGSLQGVVNTLGGLNNSFDGNSDTNILDGTAVLDPGEVLEVKIKVQLDASLVPVGGLENTVEGFGTGPNGEMPTDSSEVGINPDGSDDNEDGSVNTPTPVPAMPAIGIAKRQTKYQDAGEQPNDGNVLVTFEYIIKNIGNTRLTNIQLIDDFESNANLGSAFVQVFGDSTMVMYHQNNPDSMGTIPNLNASYDGKGSLHDLNVFDGVSGLLFPCDSITVKLVVEVDPNAPGAPVPLENLAIAQGKYMDQTVEDESYEGLDPEGGEMPTVVLAPSIVVQKEFAGGQPAASGIVGNFDVGYKFTIANVGTDTLTMVQLEDDINAQFGPPGPPAGPFVRVVPASEVTVPFPNNPYVSPSPSAFMNPTANAGYDGGVTDAFLTEMDGILAPGDTTCVFVVIEVNPNAQPDPEDPLINQAIVRGKDPDGMFVSDLSDAVAIEGGDMPTGTGLPDINVAKDIIGNEKAISGIPGNVNITFKLTVKNKGNVGLTNIVLNDNIIGFFGNSYVGITQIPVITYASPGVIEPLLGAFPTEVLDGGGFMGPNDTICIEFTVEIDPNAPGMPDSLINYAVVTAEDPSGIIVTDTSDAGLDPESLNPDHPDDMGTEDDPIYVLAPSIGVAKKLVKVKPPVVIGYGKLSKKGHFAAVYHIIIENLGNTLLDSISLIDDIQAQFGDAFVETFTPQLTLIGTNATVPPVFNPGYTGTVVDPEMLVIGVGVLAPGDTFKFEMIIEVNAFAADGPLANQILAQARGVRPDDVPSPGDPVTLADGTVVYAFDLSDCGHDPESYTEDDPFDMGTADDPTVIPVCWEEACAPVCIGSINMPLGPDCKLNITPKLALLPNVSDLCIELGFFKVVLRDVTGAVIPNNMITEQMANFSPDFTICVHNIVCPDEECCTSLTIRRSKRPMFDYGLDTMVYCTDELLALNPLSPHYPQPGVMPPCGTGFVDGPYFVADWIDASFPCSSPFAKVIYREWEAFGPGGERAMVFDIIKVLKLPEITAENLICVARDTVYCGDSVTVGPKLIVPELFGEGFDTICLTNVKEHGKCKYVIQTDTTFFGGSDCEELTKYRFEIKQDCYLPFESSTMEGASTAVITGGQGEPVYAICETWVVELDTTPPMIKKDLSKIFKVVKDTIIVPTNTHECTADVYLPPLEVKDCSGIKLVKARLPENTVVFRKSETKNNVWESHTRVNVPHGYPTEVIFEVYDSCHNIGYDTCYILVKDLTNPVAQCIDGSSVVLNGKKVWLNATNFDEGSTDNCAVNLILARRSDWTTACVDLCDTLMYFEVDDHDTIWCPVLQIDPEDKNDAESTYKRFLQWVHEDDNPCGDLIYEAWQYDLCKFATLHCFEHPYPYPDDQFEILYRKKFPEKFTEYGSALTQLGGGWSTSVPFSCEDACSEVTIELLVMDYWCNYTKCWTKVWVEDKIIPEVIVDVVPEFEIACQAFNRADIFLEGEPLPVSVKDIAVRAQERDSVAIEKLNEIFGGYHKVWEDSYGDFVDDEGQPIDLDKEFIDFTCYCTKLEKRIRAYDDHAGYIWKTVTYDSCFHASDTLKLNDGLLKVNCSEAVHCDQTVWVDMNHCGQGYVYRKFKIWNACNEPNYDRSGALDTIFRTQRIWIGNACEIQKGMFSVPDDISIVVCELDYDDDGKVTGAAHPDRTGWAYYHFDNDCRTLGIGYSDQVYKVIENNDACYKIIRTWHFMDWCDGKPAGKNWWNDKNNNGKIISIDQKIIVDDTSVPVCEIKPLEENGMVPTGGCDYDLRTSFTIEDDCGIIDYRWEVRNESHTLIRDGSGKFEVGVDEEVEIFAPDLMEGGYRIYTYVTDVCGNSDTCYYTFEVVLEQKPKAICITSLTADLSPVDLDNDGIVDTAMVRVWASEFNSSSEPACGSDDVLEFRLDLIDGIGDDIWEDDETYLDLGCDHTGILFVRVWVIDEKGNSDYCDVRLLVQDNNQVCPEDAGGPEAKISGAVTTEIGLPVNDVTVRAEMSSIESKEVKSTSQGNYELSLPTGRGVKMTLSKRGDDVNGISTSDLLLIQKHILGTKKLPTEYRKIAADINNDNKVSSIDMLTLRRIILGTIDKFPESDSWRFYYKGSYDPVMIVDEFDGDTRADFIGVKIGDINLDNDPSRKAVRSTDRMVFAVRDLDMIGGNEYRIDVKAKYFSEITGYQYSLQVDPEKMYVKEIVPVGALTMSSDHFGTRFLDQGIITVSWNSGATNAESDFGSSLNPGETLYSLKVVAREDSKLSDVMTINSIITRAEGYNNYDEILDVALVFDNAGAEAVFELFQNHPNPFRNSTTIGFSLPESSEATIRIYDMTGKLIESIKGHFERGYNSVEFYKGAYGAKGVLLYQLDTKDFTSTKRMVLIE